MPPALSVLVVFWGRVLLFVQTRLNHESSILCYLLQLGWQVHATMPSFLLRWGLKNFFAQTGLEPWSSYSQFPKKLGLQVWATSAQLLFLIGVTCSLPTFKLSWYSIAPWYVQAE
jgi:hypothetical protein